MSTDIKPDWKIVALEETSDWCPDVQAEAGRIFGLHLYDANRHVHCCEITPSYELYLFDTVCTNPCDEGLWTTLQEGMSSCDDVSYRHVHSIDRVQGDMRMDRPWDHDPDTAWEDERDEVLEYVRCNCHCPPGAL